MTEEDREYPKIGLGPPTRNVVDDDPWSDDTLNRRTVASRLDAFVVDLARSENPAVIALDGRYGTGKTFVLLRPLALSPNRPDDWRMCRKRERKN